MCWVATECSRNDGSKTQYYYVILDWLQGRSGALERAPESQIRGPLTGTHEEKSAEEYSISQQDVLVGTEYGKVWASSFCYSGC